MTIPFIIGAYASHPAPEQQEEYYKLLAQQPWINGLEMPYPGQIATDNELLAGLLAANWDFNAVTAIPGTMQNVGKDANFGLASPDWDGREAALAFTRQLREDVGKLCEHADRNVVTRIEVHSAPTRTAQGDAFRRSLEVLREWDCTELGWSLSTVIASFQSKSQKRDSSRSKKKSRSLRNLRSAS